MLPKKAQVSIEILLLASIVIFLSISVFSYYTRISETTVAMELVKIETLRQIDEAEGQYIIEEIDYKLSGNKVDFCISTAPKQPAFGIDTGALKAKIGQYGLFPAPAIVNFYHNPNAAANPCK